MGTVRCWRVGVFKRRHRKEAPQKAGLSHTRPSPAPDIRCLKHVRRGGCGARCVCVELINSRIRVVDCIRACVSEPVRHRRRSGATKSAGALPSRRLRRQGARSVEDGPVVAWCATRVCYRNLSPTTPAHDRLHRFLAAPAPSPSPAALLLRRRSRHLAHHQCGAPHKTDTAHTKPLQASARTRHKNPISNTSPRTPGTILHKNTAKPRGRF